MRRPGPGDEHRMLCTPPPRCRALPGRCRASSGVHSVRASGAVAPTEWGPLRTMSSTLGPVVRIAVRTVRGGGAVVRTRCGVVVRIGRAAAGMVRAPSGAWRASRRAARSEWRAMPPPRGAVSSRVPISHSPLSAVRPESRMCDMGPACVGQVTRNGFECGSGGRAPRPRPGGAHLLGQAVRWGRAPRMWCASLGSPVRAPSPSVRAPGCGGRGVRRSTMRTGAAAGSGRHRRCAHDAVHRHRWCPR